MRKKKWIALALSAVMVVGTLTACSGSGDGSAVSNDAQAGTEEQGTEEQNAESTDSDSGSEADAGAGSGAYVVPEEPVTIKFLHKGPKPDGWEAVYEEYLARTKDTLNIELDISWVEHADYKEKLNLEVTSGSEWDLVFDAAWVQLKNLAPEGYYADLSEYFNNPEEYPGLAAAFSEETMEANKWFDSMCYIPLFEVYGNGIPCIWYRADWAREWGIGTDGQINSYNEMEQYWQAALDAGKIAYGATQARGFFQQRSLRGEVFTNEAGQTSAEAGIMQYSSGGLNIWVYVKDNKLISYAVEGAGDEAFADFPEGWQYDFAMDRYEKFAQWQDAGFIDPDSLSVTDYNTPFSNGLSASVVGTLDDYVDKIAYEDTLGEGSIGFFIYVDAIRDMKPGAIAVNFEGNNGLAVPANSDKIYYTMHFLDWLFGSQEAHDLFQLGLEGVDFEYGENGTYTLLTDFSANMGGYGWTWNPAYALISNSYSDEVLEYRQYEYREDTFSPLPVLGFHFDTTDVDLSTSVAQCKAITDMVNTVKLHGIRTDGEGNTYDTITEMLQANTEKALQNGGQDVVNALVEQLTAFLANK